MATQEVRITGSVKVEPTREMELMIRRVVAEVVRNGPAPVRTDDAAALSQMEVARAELARVKDSVRQVVVQMDKHVIIPGSSLSRWRDVLAELIKE